MDAKTSGSTLTLILSKNVLLVSYIAIPSLMFMSLLPDFNINLLNNTAASVISYLNMLNSNAFFSLLDKPTRVTETSSSLIDHIYCNDINYDIVPGVYNYEISDHFPIFACFRNGKKKPSLKPAVNEYKFMVKFEPLKYCNSLQEVLKNLFNDHTELTKDNFFYKLFVR